MFYSRKLKVFYFYGIDCSAFYDWKYSVLFQKNEIFFIFRNRVVVPKQKSEAQSSQAGKLPEVLLALRTLNDGPLYTFNVGNHFWQYIRPRVLKSFL